jgi:hypothetical protein
MEFNELEEREYERRRQRIEELTEEIARISGIPDCTHISPDCPDETAQQFLQYVFDFESQQERPLFDALAESGVALPAPEELGDAQLCARLWDVIRAMFLFGHYLYNTDHLSDRELYRLLWTDTLRVPTTLLPQYPNFACHIDLVGSGSEEDIHLYLKHYADEETRSQWAKDWPQDIIPDHENPPYDRDRLLPQCAP